MPSDIRQDNLDGMTRRRRGGHDLARDERAAVRKVTRVLVVLR
jgi:hypothetical protein